MPIPNSKAAQNLVELISSILEQLERELAGKPSAAVAKRARELYAVRLSLIQNPDDKAAVDRLEGLVKRLENSSRKNLRRKVKG